MRKEQRYTDINDVFLTTEGQMIAQLAAQKVHNSWNRKTMMEELNHKAPRGLGMLNPKELYLSSQHYIRDVSINTVNLG